MLLVAFAAAAAFAIGVPNELLRDDVAIVGERLAGAGLSAIVGESWWGPAYADGLYRPATLLWLAAQRAVFGVAPEGYHVVSLLLHALASALVARLAGRLSGARAGLAAGLVFALHPIHAEAVLTVVGQADLLAAIGALLALDRLAAAHDTGRAIHLALATLAALLAFSSKESGLALVPLAALLRGIYVAPEERGASRWWSRREAVLLAPLALYLVARVAVVGTVAVPGGSTVTGGLEPWLRAKAVLLTVGSYARLAVWPVGQSLDQGHLAERLSGSLTREVAVLVAAGLILPRLADGTGRRRDVVFASAWFATALLPIANIVPIGVLVAERGLYLPSVGVAWLAGAVYAAACDRVGARRATPALALVGGVALVACGGMALAWRTPLDAWRSAAATHPRHALAHALQGNEAARAALSLPPGDPRATALLAEANAAFDRALALDPEEPDAWSGRGALALAAGRAGDAVSCLERALRARPGDRDIQRHLALARRAVGR